jgi:hypothetical protein
MVYLLSICSFRSDRSTGIRSAPIIRIDYILFKVKIVPKYCPKKLVARDVAAIMQRKSSVRSACRVMHCTNVLPKKEKAGRF